MQDIESAHYSKLPICDYTESEHGTDIKGMRHSFIRHGAVPVGTKLRIRLGKYKAQ